MKMAIDIFIEMPDIDGLSMNSSDIFIEMPYRDGSYRWPWRYSSEILMKI